MTNLQAALGLAQLEQIDSFVAKKRMIGVHTMKNFLPLRASVYPWLRPNLPKIYIGCIALFLILLSTDAESVMARLADYKIGTRPFFYPYINNRPCNHI